MTDRTETAGRKSALRSVPLEVSGPLGMDSRWIRGARGLAAAVVLAALPAFAQSVVEASNIEAGDVLDTAPPFFEIRFTHEVILEQLLLKTDSDEIKDLLDPAPPPRQAAFAIPLPELRDGDYVLTWRVSGNGDDAASGEIDFIVVGFHDHSEHDHSDHPH